MRKFSNKQKWKYYYSLARFKLHYNIAIPRNSFNKKFPLEYAIAVKEAVSVLGDPLQLKVIHYGEFIYNPILLEYFNRLKKKIKQKKGESQYKIGKNEADSIRG